MAHTRIRAILATAMLRDDHRKVRELFSEYESLADGAPVGSRLDLFLEIQRELAVHSDLEEEIFYPAIESLRSKDGEAGDLVREAREDHQEVRTLLDELADLEPEDEAFDERMKILIERVTEHADREEEEIFPYFDALPRDERIRVSDELRLRKQERAEEDAGE